MGNLSIKVKLTFMVGLLLLITFMGLSYYNYKSSEISITNRVLKKDLPIIANAIKSEIELELLPKITLVSTMAHNHFIKEWFEDGENNLDTIKNYLKTIGNNYNIFTASVISKITNNYYTQDGIAEKMNKENPKDSWFYSFLESGKVIDINIEADSKKNNTLTTFINYLLKDTKGNVLGAVSIGLDMNNVIKHIKKSLTPSRNVFMIDKNAYIMVHKNKSLIYDSHNDTNPKEKNIKYITGINKLADKILSSKDSITGEYTDINDNKKIIISTFIPSMNAYLIVEEDKEALFSEISSIFVKNIVISLLASLFSILLILFLLNKMIFQRFYNCSKSRSKVIVNI